MRLPKRYIINVLKKRLIEFILMYSVIFSVIFGAYMTIAESGTGILYQLDDDWYIDTNYLNNPDYFYTYLGIRNPHSFPHVLIPENIGKEVHYIHGKPNQELIYLPVFVTVFTLDLVPVFINKQFILYICIAMSSIVVFTYLYLNRKRFHITDKLLG